MGITLCRAKGTFSLVAHQTKASKSTTRQQGLYASSRAARTTSTASSRPAREFLHARVSRQASAAADTERLTYLLCLTKLSLLVALSLGSLLTARVGVRRVPLLLLHGAAEEADMEADDKLLLHLSVAESQLPHE